MKPAIALAASAALLPLAAGAPANPQPPIQLKRTSHFQLPDGARNPFWPIGWKPAIEVIEPAKTTDEPVVPRRVIPTLTPEMFTVSSVSLNPLRIAVINGRVYAEGDAIRIGGGGSEIRAVVTKVDDGQVTIANDSSRVVIQLRGLNKPGGR
jgi:hypothetical protein